MRYTPENINKLAPNEIFCYGANQSWIHGAGAARIALMKFGAIMGKGPFNGQSYGICTKDYDIWTLPLNKIEEYVIDFLDYAKENPDKIFLTTAIGCGLAGWTPDDIAPMFKDHPKNVILPKEFHDVISHM